MVLAAGFAPSLVAGLGLLYGRYKIVSKLYAKASGECVAPCFEPHQS